MLNVSRKPTIRPGSHELIRIDQTLEPYLQLIQLTWGVILDRKDWVQPCRAPNMKIYPNESLSNLKYGNLKFGGSRGKMIFF